MDVGQHTACAGESVLVGESIAMQKWNSLQCWQVYYMDAAMWTSNDRGQSPCPL